MIVCRIQNIKFYEYYVVKIRRREGGIMDILSIGCFKTILERYAEPIMKKVIEITKDEWEKFKVDFDIAFIEYMKNSYDKYSKIKTILYRTEPKYIYDFFEVPLLEFEHQRSFKVNSVNSVLEISNFVIIQGIGGIGKSTLMKHLFINELEEKDLIPVFLELKDINDCDKEYEIGKIILEKINNLGSKLDFKYFEYALKSGCFLFLFDGYDEILSKNRDVFFKKLDSFCDKYSQNYFIISSRPYSEFVEFQRYSVVNTCPLSKEQAIDLVGRIDFDKDIKKRFINELDSELFIKHKSFASNPLLLNIMLLTYDNYAEIPEKLHLFYDNAFETLYSKHDATKAGYRRELKSALSYDSFKKVFAYFCFISYAQGKIEFSYHELVMNLKKVKINKISFDIDNYISDLVNSLCVLYKEGINYKFTHRSFQEFFSALFLRELSDESMEQMGKQLIFRDPFRISYDSVFDMLYDMSEDRFERNILLPILKDYEQKCLNDKYDFYFRKIVNGIRFDFGHDEMHNQIILWLSMDMDSDNGVRNFIYRCAKYYIKRGDKKSKESQAISDKVLDYLMQNKSYEVGKQILIKDIVEDSILYEMFKETWIGERITVMSNLSVELTKKQDKIEIDLSNLLIM